MLSKPRHGGASAYQKTKTADIVDELNDYKDAGDAYWNHTRVKISVLSYSSPFWRLLRGCNQGWAHSARSLISMLDALSARNAMLSGILEYNASEQVACPETFWIYKLCWHLISNINSYSRSWRLCALRPWTTWNYAIQYPQWRLCWIDFVSENWRVIDDQHRIAGPMEFEGDGCDVSITVLLIFIMHNKCIFSPLSIWRNNGQKKTFLRFIWPCPLS